MEKLDENEITELAKPSISDQFKKFVLDLWIDISNISQAYRQSFLTFNVDPEYRLLLVNKMIELWLQLIPKVVGLEDDSNKKVKEISKKMVSFEKYYRNPVLLISEDAGLEILDFQKTLRECLEILGITTFEEV